MADKVFVFNQKNSLPDDVEIFYTADADPAGNGARIKAFTASNDSEASVHYKAYIYAPTGEVVSAIIPQTIVVKDRADYGASAINQVIPPGGTLRMESSTADALNFYVTGVEQ